MKSRGLSLRLALLHAALLSACGGGLAVVGGDTGPAEVDAAVTLDATSALDAVDAATAPDLPRDDIAPLDVGIPDLDVGIPDLDVATTREDIAPLDVTSSACAELCATPESCCRGACVDTDADPTNCGACGRSCAPGTPCVGGSCGPACPNNLTACSQGCVDTSTDTSNCGRCGEQCPVDSTCEGGVCACPQGQVLCGGVCAPAGCTVGRGACERPGAQRCMNGGLVCEGAPGAPAAFEICNNVDDDCDGMVDEGVTRPCFSFSRTPGVGICRAGSQLCAAGGWGACSGEVGPQVETCNGLDDDCDGIRDNIPAQGCFTGPSTARGRGRCRDGALQCAAGALRCVNEVLPLPEICNNEDDDCDGMVDNNPTSIACPGRPNAAASCVIGTCRYACAPGFADCDGNINSNGCETDLRTDPMRCGTCTNRCAAGTACDNGACTMACSGTICGGQCVDLSSNASHCGGCNVVCSAPSGGSARCVSGGCASSCPSGTTQCGLICADLSLDPGNCGSCGNACGPGRQCQRDDTGTPTCTCGNNGVLCAGVCRDVRSDAQNCGACGVQCGAGQSCQSGACRCNATDATLCNGACVRLGDPCSAGVGACRRGGSLVCGSAGPICDAVAATPSTELCNSLDDDCDGVADNNNAEASCTTLPFQLATCLAGACSRACLPGRGNCDGVVSNGCEADLLTSAANCGRCGAQCSIGQSCVQGACVTGGLFGDAGARTDAGDDAGNDTD